MAWPCSWSKADYDRLMATLARILENQEQINKRLLKQEKNVMGALDDLRAQVQENADLEQSAIAVIQGIAEQLREAVNNDDSDALQALSQQLDASAAGLAAAIAANTSAASTPPPGDDPQVNPLSRKR